MQNTKLLAGRALAAGGAIGVALLMASTAFAAPSLFGGATTNGNGVTLVSNLSDATTTDDYSGISLSDANGMTFGSLTDLAATFDTTGSDCKAGSPRFSIGIDTNGDGVADGNVFVYFGPSPNFTGCTAGSQSTGNLIGNTDQGRFDFSQLGGPQVGTYADAPASVLNGKITNISLVVDSGWAFASSTQSAVISNVTINGTTHTFGSLMAPTLTSPANGSTMTSADFTNATWSDVTSSSSPVTYTYEVSNSSATNPDGSFTTPVFQQSGLTSAMIPTTNTPEGTYYWQVQAMDADGNMSPWSTMGTFTIANLVSTSTGTTTPPAGGSLSDLLSNLQMLLGQFPNYSASIQNLINSLNGTGTSTTTPPNTGPAPSIDQNGQSVGVGGSIDFVGRNFGHEETVNIMLNGSTVGSAHADGGGNFSTGSMSVPSTPGTYTYTFMGATSGLSTTATITVM